MTDQEKYDLLYKVVCKYINDQEIPIAERDAVSYEIIPFIHQLEPGKETDSDQGTADGFKVFFNLSKFKPGDIVYSYENENYVASLFVIPENFNPDSNKVVLTGKWFVDTSVLANEEWKEFDGGTIYHEPGISYRYATEEEKKMFNQ